MGFCLNCFGILSDKKEIKDVLEIVIDNIYLNGKEGNHYIFMYLDKDYLSKLKENYKLKRL